MLILLFDSLCAKFDPSTAAADIAQQDALVPGAAALVEVI